MPLPTTSITENRLRTHVPRILQHLPRWVCWEQTPHGKQPKNPRTGGNAKCNDRKTWTSFEVALRAFRQCHHFGGLSFGLNGDGVVGIDLDKCRDPETGQVEGWAAEVIQRFNSYTEITPSGQGIRIFLRGKLPPSGRKHGHIEVYSSDKFLSVTGNRLRDHGAGDDVEDRSEELLAWHSEVWGDQTAKNSTKGKGDLGLTLNLQPTIPEQRLQHLFRVKPDAQHIFEGGNGYTSQSEADLALANFATAAGFGAQETCDLLVQARQNAGEPIKGLGYLERTVSKARESLTPPAEPPEQGNLLNDFISSGEPKLGEEAYHGFLGMFIREVSPLTEATDACILGHLLAAIATRIGPELHVWGGDRQPCRFNVAIVGPTSTGRKGTGWVPARELLRATDPEFWQDQPVKGLSSGEGLIARVTDKTVKDDEGNKQIEPVEKRLLVLESEFSRVLMQSRREGNILSQVLREAYDSGDLGVLTRTPLLACGAHVSVIGHITADELNRRLDQLEMANGFANRFLWFLVRSNKRLPNAEPIPPAILEKYANQLTRFFNYTDKQSCKNPRFTFSAEARSKWEEEYPKLCQDRPGFVGAMTARGSSHVLRLALLYALLDMAPRIRLCHLEAALAVWRYCDESVQLLFGKKQGDSLADRVFELLGNGPMLTREFYRHLSTKSDDLQAVLEQLERNGLVERVEEKTGKRGRPAVRWSRAE